MTQAQRTELEQALIRANRRGIYIIATGRRKANGARLFLTNSGMNLDGTHIVLVTGNRLTCDCKSRVVCTHRAIVHQRLAEEAATVRQTLAELDAQRRDDGRWYRQYLREDFPAPGFAG